MAVERKPTNRLWLWIGAAILLILVFFAARALTRDRMPIHAAAAQRAELVSTVSTNGLVEPERNYEFHSPAATTIKSINVNQGDQVKAGQLLMTLDDLPARARVASAESALRNALASNEATQQNGTLEERQSLISNINRAQLDLAQAQRERAALEKLQSSGAASPSEVAAARQRETLAQDNLTTLQGRQKTRYSPAEIARAHSSVADAQANLAAARAVIEQSAIKSPVDGTVFSIAVGRSDFVEQGKLLLQVADLRHLRVRAYFDEPEIGRLATGQKIRIVWDASPGREWHGRIVQVPSTVTVYNTRNVGEVLISIDEPDSGLLPDTHVTVTATTASIPNTLTVPREALHSENGKPYVYKIVNNTLVRTDITTGLANLTQVPVTSGLRDGDLVATGSLNGLPLEDGTPVKVVR